jgi:hypothetical protein
VISRALQLTAKLRMISIKGYASLNQTFNLTNRFQFRFFKEKFISDITLKKCILKAKHLISMLVIGTVSILFGPNANSQVVISLLFGDKLNSESIKFGLDGGFAYSNLSNVNSSDNHRGFNLGFYFDFDLNEKSNLFLHTGLMLKSPMGTDGLAPYSLDNAGLDSTYKNGTVNRQLKYINVPLLLRYKFKNHLFVEAGPMLGVMVKATDVFYATVNEDKDQSYKNNVTDQFNWFDAGIQAGIGYQLMKGNGMNIGFRYYYGLMDVVKDNPSDSQKNSSYNIYASIPIGAGEKAKAKKEAKAKEKQAQ